MKTEESLSILKKINNAFLMHKKAYLLESDFNEKTQYHDELLSILKLYQNNWCEIFESLTTIIFERYERNFTIISENRLFHKESGACWTLENNKIEFNIYKDSPWKLFPAYHKDELMTYVPLNSEHKNFFNIIGGDKLLFEDFVKQAFIAYVDTKIPEFDEQKVNNKIISTIQNKLKEADYFPFDECLINYKEYCYWIDTDWCNWKYVIDKDIFAFFFDNEKSCDWMKEKENAYLIDMFNFLKKENYKKGSYAKFNMYEFDINTKFSDFPTEEQYKKEVVRYMNSVVFKQFYEIPVMDFDKDNEVQQLQYTFQHAMLHSVNALLEKMQSCNNHYFEKWLVSSYGLEKINLIKKVLKVNNEKKLITVNKEKINELLPLSFIEIENDFSAKGELFLNDLLEKKEREEEKARKEAMDKIIKMLGHNKKNVMINQKPDSQEKEDIKEKELSQDKLVLKAFNEKDFLLLRDLKQKGWTVEKEINYILNKNNYNIIDFIFHDGHEVRSKSEIQALLNIYIESEEDMQLLLKVNSINGNALTYFVMFYHRQGYLNNYIKFLIKNGQSLEEYSKKHNCAVIDIVKNQTLAKLIRYVDIQAQKEKISEKIAKETTFKEVKRI